MKIVFYTHGLAIHGASLEDGPLGGSESALISLARALARLGHRVTVFCPCPVPGDYHGVAYRDRADYPAWASTGECDLFVCSRAFYIFPNVPRSRVRVLWNHDFIGEKQGAGIAYAAAQCSYIYCLSRFQALHYRDVLHAEMPARRAGIDRLIRILPNGVDQQAAAAARAGAVKVPRLMFTSRPQRGLAEALDIFEALGDRAVEFLACTYPDLGESEGAVWAPFEKRIGELRGNGFRISFGQFAKPELFARIAESIAVLYPTRSAETFCISAAESQACGTFFATSATSSLPEIARHAGLAGDSPAGYVRLLRRLLDDPGFRRDREREGLDHVGHCDWSLIARRFAGDAAAHMEGKSVRAPGPCPAPDRLPEVTCVAAAEGSLIDVKQAIADYCAQTYEARRLALLLCGGMRFEAALRRHVEALGRDDIDLVAPDAPGPSTPLSCRWLPGDLHHPERLGLQVRHLLAGHAARFYLRDMLCFDEDGRRLTWVDASRDGLVTGGGSLIRRTLLCRQSAGLSWREIAGLEPESDEALAQPEIAALEGAGWAYVQRRGRALDGRCLPPASLSLIEPRLNALRSALAVYPLPRPYRVEGPWESLFVQG